MLREFTCIMCPQGCEITVEEKNGELCISGNKCPKGRDYAVSEITDPKRNIATSVLVKHGRLPLVSIRLTEAVPKSRIFEVVKEIHERQIEAPVYEGDIIIHSVLGLDSDVIATKTVERKEEEV